MPGTTRVEELTEKIWESPSCLVLGIRGPESSDGVMPILALTSNIPPDRDDDLH